MTETPVISGRRARRRGGDAPPPPLPDQNQPRDEAAADADQGPQTPAGVNPAAQWWDAARKDAAERKQRGAGKTWFMRWMAEQPTSVSHHLHFYLEERTRRPYGRPGWGLRTPFPIVNGLHAAFYAFYGLTFGLVATLACYTLAWMCQRPGRVLLLAAALLIVRINLSTWLGR